ncbi:RNA polymerase subunit sigma-70 [bacterium]|nr:RNA polymerase subunit sigma-70 [bacterium]
MTTEPERSTDQNRNTMSLNSGAGAEPGTPGYDELFELTFQELRGMARMLMHRERKDHTLQPTALVHEAFLTLFNHELVTVGGKAHFLNIAAKVMRNVLVDHARRKNSQKRGGGWQPVTLTGLVAEGFQEQVDVLDLNLALERYAEIDPRGARVVELRLFGGLTMEEVAEATGVTRRTAQRDWRIAAMWLKREFSQT